MSMIPEYLRLRPRELTELQPLLLDGPEEAYEYASDLQLGLSTGGALLEIEVLAILLSRSNRGPSSGERRSYIGSRSK